MVGIIFAMQKELDALDLKDPIEEKVGGQTFLLGKVGKQEVVCVITGPGKVFAAMCTEAMILRYAPAFIINCGIAGALSPSLHIYDIVVGTSCMQHDMDTSAIGDLPGMISRINMIYLPCDEKLTSALMQAAEKAALPAYTGIIATGDRFCADDGDKTAIREKFNAVACEMESGAVAQVCYVNQVPFAAIRAISDGADAEAMVAYNTFAEKAAKNAGLVLTNFLESFAM